MKKIKIIAAMCLCCIMAVACNNEENAAHNKSVLKQVGGVGDFRILVLQNGARIESRSEAAFAAKPGDTIEYYQTCRGVIVEVWFSEEHQAELPKKVADSESGVVMAPIVMPVAS